MRKLLTLLFLFGCVGGAGWYVATHHTTPITLFAPTTRTGEARLYPPKQTLGQASTTDAGVVCQPTYYRSVPEVPKAMQKSVFKNAGVPYPGAKGAYEVDHFIPTELGGSSNTENLWLQADTPLPGYHEKNMVENYLHAQVCTGQITLAEAQKAVAQDWYAVYRMLSH